MNQFLLQISIYCKQQLKKKGALFIFNQDQFLSLPWSASHGYLIKTIQFKRNVWDF